MSRELVRQLLEARDEAKEELSGYLGLRESETKLVEMLAVSKGAVVGFKDVRPRGFKNRKKYRQIIHKSVYLRLERYMVRCPCELMYGL